MEVVTLADKYFTNELYSKALQLYLKADSMQQSGHVAYRIGVSYKMAYGAPEDVEKSEKYFAIALRLLQKSDAEFKAQTDPQILFDLGVIFSSGYGCVKNTPVAFAYFERGAAQGHALSLCNLGDMLYSGKGCQKNDARAIECFQKASDLGLVSGFTWLGFVYQQLHNQKQNLNSMDTEPNYDELSTQCYIKAAYKSEPFACDKLVNFYEKSLGDDPKHIDENDEDKKTNLLKLVQFAYLGLHNDVQVVQPMKDILDEYISVAILVLWQKFKDFILVDPDALYMDEKKVIFFMMLFECKSIYFDFEH